MQPVPYKGFLIMAWANGEKDSGEFTLNMTIVRDADSPGIFRPFSVGGGSFESSEDANNAAVRVGMQIIDGEVQGCNVDGL